MRAKQIAADFTSAAEAMVVAARLTRAADALAYQASLVKGSKSPLHTTKKLEGWARTVRKDAELLLDAQKEYCDGFGGLADVILRQEVLDNGARVSLVSYRHLPGSGELGWAVIGWDGHLSYHPDFSPDRGHEEHLLEFLERVEALTPEEVRRLFGGS